MLSLYLYQPVKSNRFFYSPKISLKYSKKCLSFTIVLSVDQPNNCAGFPSDQVMAAYMNPKIDANKEKFSWSVPNFVAVRNLDYFCFSTRQLRSSRRTVKTNNQYKIAILHFETSNVMQHLVKSFWLYVELYFCII